MKILIDIPDSARPDYHRLHQHLAMELGVAGANPFRLPLSIDRLDSTTHKSNYTVIAFDQSSDDVSWSTMAVLTFKLRPGAPMEPLSETCDEEIADHLRQQYLQHQEDEERAIFAAMADAGLPIRTATSGRRFAEYPSIRIYEKHILVTQYGGIDC